jgi:seryl-tRNA synthetase
MQGEKEVFGEKLPEIEKLRERLEKIEPHLEKEKTFEEKEKTIKQEIKNYLKELQKTPSFAPPVSTRDEVEEIKKFEPDQQVGALISLVFEKGLETAVSVARALDNPAILDEFHDTLVDRYYEILVEKGILKF